MEIKPVLNLPTAQPDMQTVDAHEAARALGEVLSHAPEYRIFLEALNAINDDPAIQSLSAQMRACQLNLRWGRDVKKNAAELERLERELNAMPLFQTYRQEETAIRRLFVAVDEAISRECGVEFAANAKRSSCCG